MMRSGDSAPNVTSSHPPPSHNGSADPPRSDSRSSQSSASDQVPRKHPSMTPKSAAIAARTNYVSPYRQTPPSKPAASSTPRANNAKNAGSANFKDIRNRFNTTQDEKVPSPTNRIPASSVSSARGRKPMGAVNGTGRPGSSASRNRQQGRSNSAMSNHSTGSKVSVGDQAGSRRPSIAEQTGPRRPSTALSNASEKGTSRKVLPQLDTSNFGKDVKQNGRRRSLATAASSRRGSIADNESSDSSEATRLPLHHRRSRSNIEDSVTPLEDIKVVDPLLTKREAEASPTSPRSPLVGNPDISVVAQSAPSSPDRKNTAKSRIQKSQPKKSSAIPAVSSHGSRHTPQPLKSPNLAAYISTPLPKKSPPLRSSRGHRIPDPKPVSSSLPRFQQPTATSQHKTADRKLKKSKIPELTAVDFAARRARIQNAFTKSLQDDELKRTNSVRRPSRRRESEGAESVMSHEAEEDKAAETPDTGRFPIGIIGVMPTLPESTMKVLEQAVSSPVIASPQDASDSDPEFHTPELQSTTPADAALGLVEHEAISPTEPLPSISMDTGPQAANESPVYEDNEVRLASPSDEEAERRKRLSRISVRSARFSLHEESPADAPPWRNPDEKSDSEPEPTPISAGDPVPVAEGHLAGTEEMISVVVTPESNAQRPNLFTQVSDALRTGWSDSVANSPMTPYEQSPEGWNVKGISPETLEKKNLEVQDDAAGRASYTSLSPNSPMVSTASSDDRATIVSVFDKYDEPREDFLKSYQPTPIVGTVAEIPEPEEVPPMPTREAFERKAQLHNDEDSYTSSSGVPESSRPSVDTIDTEEGWTTSSEAEVSPEIVVRNFHVPQRQPQTPTTPRRTYEYQSPEPPPPPPKDSPPLPPIKDASYTFSRSPSLYSQMTSPPQQSESTRASSYLPEIEPDPEPLGLALQGINLERDPLRRKRSNRFFNGARSNRPSMEEMRRTESYASPRPSVDKYASSTFPKDRYSSTPSSFYSEPEFQRSSSFTSNGHRMSETTAASSIIPPRDSISARTEDTLVPPDDPEQKRLRKRYNLLREIVDTEDAYFRDMTLAEEIYKGTANSCSSLNSEDIKILFGNTDQIVIFSKHLLEVLKAAVSSVYDMRQKKDGLESSATSLANSQHSGDREDETDEEKDRKTYIGEAFAECMYKMERVYGDYSKTCDIALARLKQLEDENQGVRIWLSECAKCAADLTNAWNLSTILIKPIQRVCKYPILLTELLSVTPRDHPDYQTLEAAQKEIGFAATRINEIKRRKELVDKVLSRKRDENNIRYGISKSFARQAEKLKQSVGLSDAVQDDNYNRLFENYNMHFMQVQVIIRDFEIYVHEIQSHVDKCVMFSEAFRAAGEAIRSKNLDIEERWRNFDGMMKDLSVTYLQEHKHRVNKCCIEPLETLLRMQESCQKIMTKRNKKAIDYARYKAILDRGNHPDEATKKLADVYLALNETLIEDLPKLFSYTKMLVDLVLVRFIKLQEDWMNSWCAKIKMTYIDVDLPLNAENIVTEFTPKFVYNERLVESLGICNGTVLTREYPSPTTQFLSPSATTLSVNDMTRPQSANPQTEKAGDDYFALRRRQRSSSFTGQSPTVASFNQAPADDTRRHSGGSPNLSPLSPLTNHLGPSTVNIGTRARAISNSPMPARSPSAPTPPPSHSSHFRPVTNPRSNTITDRYSSATQVESPIDRPHLARSPYTSIGYITSSRDPSRPSSPPVTNGVGTQAFSSALPMQDDRDRVDHSRPASRQASLDIPDRHIEPLELAEDNKPMFLAVSLYEFHIDRARREGGFPYLTYGQGEIFDVIGIKGEVWLAKNQDDERGEIGWIWCKHFTKIGDS